eukprot:Platyproteum_vivax@DN8892_c0_g1_i1.p1
MNRALQRLGWRSFAASKNVPISRCFSSASMSNLKAERRLDNLIATVMSANWADCVECALDYNFWLVEKEAIRDSMGALEGDPQCGPKLQFMNEMFDVYLCTEDVRDHINEMVEAKSRSTGIAGTGILAKESIENFDEHCQACAQRYDELKKEHPQFIPQIEETVGAGLSILRQKHKFRWSSMHEWSY